MPRNAVMSWEGPPHYRWVKMFKGVRHRVNCSDLPVSRENWTWDGSYQAANQWWAEKLRTLGELPFDPQRHEMEARIQWAKENEPDEVPELERLLQHDISEEESTVASTLAYLRDQGVVIELPEDVDAQVLKEVFGNERIWQDRRARMVTTPKDSTLTATIAEFLAIVGQQTKPKTYRELKEYLEKLPTALPDDVGKIDEITVGKVYAQLAMASLSAATRKKRFGFFKRFVKYLYEGNRIELPRNLDSALFQFKVSPQAIKTHLPADVQTAIGNLQDRLALFALLGLNCGMTNADIGAMRQDAIESGYLTRKRVKTVNHDNVPVVKYKLWQETKQLLNQFRSSDPDLWLVSNAGTPLWSGRIEDGCVKEKDLIAKAWQKAKCPIKLKEFRSISATTLETHKEYGRYVSYFLGHSPRTLKDKHYAAPSQTVFDDALAWLGEKFACTP